MTTQRHPPIFQSVPADEFTDREAIIDRLVRIAINTPRDMTFSTAMVGQRRLGKTAVLEQVYNRLFWEQDAVVPIYFTFEAQPTTSTEFAETYFARWKPETPIFMMLDEFQDVLRITYSDGKPADRRTAGQSHHHDSARVAEASNPLPDACTHMKVRLMRQAPFVPPARGRPPDRSELLPFAFFSKTITTSGSWDCRSTLSCRSR